MDAAIITQFLSGLSTLTPTVAIILLATIIITYAIKNIKSINTFFKSMFTIKRTNCKDCISLLLDNSEKYWNGRKLVTDNILPSQMLAVNQFIEKYCSDKMEEYSNILAKSSLTPDEQIKELLMSKFLLIFALDTWTKLEMRRSFRQNHFDTMSDIEFKVYINKEFEIMKSQLKMHISNFYPISSTIPLSVLFEMLDLDGSFKSHIENCYYNAKTIKVNSIKEIEILKYNYDNYNKNRIVIR